jgi:hypothetical protein
MVCSLSPSSVATPRLVKPSATSATTCSSPGVNKNLPLELTTRRVGTSDSASTRQFHLLAVDPNLAASNALDAFAGHRKRSSIEKKNTSGASAHGIHDEFALVAVDQPHGRNTRIRKA